MVSTPFHVKCRYTNKLICFCAHGNQRLGSGKERKEFSERADRLWSLYKEVCQKSNCKDTGVHAVLLKDVVCDVALPPLKPRFPLTEEKRTQGWAVSELRQTLGDEKTMLVLESAFTPKQWKQMAMQYGSTAFARGTSFAGDDLNELEKILGGRRIALSDVKRILQDAIGASRELESRSAKLREAAVTFEEEAQTELKALGPGDGEGDGDGEARCQPVPADVEEEVEARPAAEVGDEPAEGEGGSGRGEAKEEEGEFTGVAGPGDRGATGPTSEAATPVEPAIIFDVPKQKRSAGQERRARKDFSGWSFATWGKGREGEGERPETDEELAMRLNEELNAPPAKRLRRPSVS